MVQLVDPPRKPYVARGSGVTRCDGCRLPQEVCICEHRHALPAACEFWLLTHRYEFYKPTNTGRLIFDSVANTRIFEWSRTEPEAELLQALADPRYAPCLIFPPEEDYQHRVVREVGGSSGRIPAFIILDGTWRQARRMFRHSAYLQQVPVLDLQTQRLSRYQLRRSKIEEHLCTAEVAIAVLEQVGEAAVAAHLEGYFDCFNQNYIATRRRWAKQER